jgi:2'-hydroxyisoflavone reductase
MRILIIGGTRFVGRAVTEAAALQGHDVTVFHRGSTPLSGLDGVKEILGDRDGPLEEINGEWDATVDVCAYRPSQVERLSQALQGRGGLHVFISTVSVYASDIPSGSDESAQLVDTAALQGLDLDTCAIDGQTYGPLKVRCEEAARERYRDPLIIRPTYVIGPEDYTMRYPTWVERISRGGRVEIPDPATTPVQYIDARDQAAFIVNGIAAGLSGTFHLANPQPPYSFARFIEETAAALAPAGTELVAVSEDESSAPASEFPLWVGRDFHGAMALDSSAARAAGLDSRSLAESARDTAAWLASLA